MPTSPKKKTDFYEWSFEVSGQNPLAWMESADNLLTAARAVGNKVQHRANDSMDPLVAVEAMLVGYAIECLLKATWIKKHKAWDAAATKGSSLTANGKLVRIKGVGDHRLDQLASAVGTKLSQPEKKLLPRLSGFVLFSGRYPIPTTVEALKPAKGVSPTFISESELELAYALAERLMEGAKPWQK